MIFAAIACNVRTINEEGLLIKRNFAMFVTATLLATSSAPGAIACAAVKEQLQAGPRAKIVEVQDGDTVLLDNGMKVRLLGIQGPKFFQGRGGREIQIGHAGQEEKAGARDWPLAKEAKAALVRIGLNRDVQLWFGGAQSDRHGRTLAHLFIDDDGTAGSGWVQGKLVALGLARVYSFVDNRACVQSLYAYERQARIDRLGLWATSFYAVRNGHNPSEILERAGFFEVVEGRVLNADRVGSRIYLNFGRYWKEDFTVVIETKRLKLFSAIGFDPLELEGALVRVRGWVDVYDGPRVDVTHPEQIEVLARK